MGSRRLGCAPTSGGTAARGPRSHSGGAAELVELGQAEGVAHARGVDLEDGAAALDVERRDEALGLARVDDLHAIEHPEQGPRPLEPDAVRAGGRGRRDARPHQAPAAGAGELHGRRVLRAVRVLDGLSVHVEGELLDRRVHLDRLEIELDARRADAAAEEHVADDLRALELRQRRRLANRRVLEAPRRLSGVDLLRQVLLEEAVEQAVLRKQTAEVLGSDVEVAASHEWIASLGHFYAEVGDLRPQLGVDVLSLFGHGSLLRRSNCLCLLLTGCCLVSVPGVLDPRIGWHLGGRNSRLRHDMRFRFLMSAVGDRQRYKQNHNCGRRHYRCSWKE